MSIFLAVLNFIYCIFTLLAALRENEYLTTKEKIAWVIMFLTFMSNAVYMVIMS